MSMQFPVGPRIMYAKETTLPSALVEHQKICNLVRTKKEQSEMCLGLYKKLIHGTEYGQFFEGDLFPKTVAQCQRDWDMPWEPVLAKSPQRNKDPGVTHNREGPMCPKVPPLQPVPWKSFCIGAAIGLGPVLVAKVAGGSLLFKIGIGGLTFVGASAAADIGGMSDVEMVNYWGPIDLVSCHDGYFEEGEGTMSSP